MDCRIVLCFYYKLLELGDALHPISKSPWSFSRNLRKLLIEKVEMHSVSCGMFTLAN